MVALVEVKVLKQELSIGDAEGAESIVNALSLP